MSSWLVLSPRRVWQVSVSLIVFQALVRLLMGLGTYFTQDDFVFYTLGATQDFTLEYLFQDRGNHLMPAGQAIVWPLARLVPLEHGPAVLVIVVLQLLASLAVLGLLRELFGLRTRILAPLSFYLFGVLTLPAFLWWAASLNAIGLQLAMALALRFHLRWIRARRAWSVVGTLAATLLGLAFFEKAVLFLPLLIGLSWVVERHGSPGRDLLRILRRHWWVWLLLVAEVSAWTGLYVSRIDTAYAQRAGAGVTADLILDSVSQGLIPAIFSGPWAWTPSTAFLGFAPAPPTGLMVLSWLAFLVVFAATLIVRRGMGRVWVVALGYVAIDLALIAGGRAGAFGPGVGLEYRYYADSALVMAFVVGYAFIPLRQERRPWTEQSAQLRAWASTNRAAVSGIGWVALLAWGVVASWSSLALAEEWRSSVARTYIETAKSQLAQLDPATELLDEPVPQGVMLGWFEPLNGTSYVFAPLHDRPEFVPSVTELWTIDPSGEIVEGEVDGLRSRIGPNPGCGWAVTAERPTTIPLDRAVYEWNWTAQVNYLAGTETIATFQLGDEIVDVPLEKGLNEVFFALPSTGNSIKVSLARPGAGVCIDQIEIGNRLPVEDLDSEPLAPPTTP